MFPRPLFSGGNLVDEVFAEYRFEFGVDFFRRFLEGRCVGFVDFHAFLLEFFDFTNLPFTIMPVELDHFKSLIIKAKESLED